MTINTEDVETRLRRSLKATIPQLLSNESQSATTASQQGAPSGADYWGDGVSDIPSATPRLEPDDLDANRWTESTNKAAPRRTGAYLIAAAAAVAVTVAGLVAVSGRADEPSQSNQPAPAEPSEQPAPGAATALPEVDTTLSASVAPVVGLPTCGSDLPVTVDAPSAPGGPVAGPATFGAAIEGQLVQHWEVPAGTIEMRWPADERELYDLEQQRGDPTAFDPVTVSVASDGSFILIAATPIDPELAVGNSTLTMTANSATPYLQPPCDVLQVRFIDRDGNQMTRGYDVTDFYDGIDPNRDPSYSSEIDLNPLVTSRGDATEAPDPATTLSCNGDDIDRDVTAPAASTPAEALAAYLATDEASASISHGYREFEISDNQYQYAIIYDDGTLITLFTIDRTGQNWAVSHVTSVGC